MQLIVDFNMREADGRVPALLVGGAASELSLGEFVVASDGEGLACTARVTEITSDGRIAMLETVGGTFKKSTFAPSASDLLTGLG